MALPTVLTYFVPGYIYLWVKCKANNEREKNATEMLYLAIVATFLINMIAFWAIKVITGIDSEKAIMGGYTYGNMVAVALAVVLGLIVGPCVKSSIMKRIKLKLNIRNAPFADIWNKVTDKSAWVTVYMDSLNIAYVGRIIYVSSNPNIEKREMYIKNYKVYNTAEGNLMAEHNGSNEGVFIDCKNVTRIEFMYD